MAADEDSRTLDPARDSAAIKALTHPLRIRLLGLLRQHGPSTASELAVLTDESSASTSYHLRVLAKHGFVGEAAHRDARERRWQAVHAVTSWSNTAMEMNLETRAFSGFMRRRQIEHLQESLDRYEAQVEAGRMDEAWWEPAGISDLGPKLTPESLEELWGVVERTLAELTARDAEDPRAAHVTLFLAGLPQLPTGAAETETPAERS
ncbi:helix-turn-helix domain-containing protein [Streptomyces sp. NPDC097619]|uniref:helix-turn-helix domain-containing protein n=1 Tax=Streptomyces sp. NPDC097619 TaxID=3157228 RepID=UPI00332B2248